MKKLLLLTLIVGLFSVMTLTSAYAGLTWFNSTNSFEGDTYTNYTATTTNFGQNNTLWVYCVGASCSTGRDTSYLWYDLTTIASRYGASNIIAGVTNASTYTAMSPTGLFMYLCSGTLNYSWRNENTLTYATDNSSFCSAWSIASVELSACLTINANQTCMTAIPTSYLNNTGSLTNVIRYYFNYSTNTFVKLWSKQGGNETFAPKLGLYILSKGEFYVYRAKEEIGGTDLTYNVTYSNGSTTVTQGSQTAWNWINNNSINGDVTISIDNATGTSYYPSNFYNTISAVSTGKVVSPMLVNKTGIGTNLPYFYVVNVGGSPVANAIIDIDKSLSGSYNTIRQGKTDSAGVSQLPVISTTTYRVIACSGTICSAYQYITPSASSYTIVLGLGGVTYQNTLFSDISYSISPLTVSIPKSNSTSILFTVTANHSNLEYIKLNVTSNGSRLYLGNSTSATGGTLTATFNSSNLSLVTAVFTIKKADFSEWSMTRNYAVVSFGAGNYSLLTFLGTTFKNDTSIPDFWKQVICILVSIAIMGLVAKYTGELASAIVGGVALTFFAILGWFSWVYLIISWLLIVGLLLASRGLG